MFETLLDPIFRPLLSIPLFLAIMLISILMSVIIIIAYKLMTDQSLMKDLKTEIKSFQKEMKELRKEPEKMMKVQKKAMETNMKYMMHSMKPTLITFLPIIIIFGWLNANIAFEPISPGQDFSTTAFMDASGNVVLDVPEGITLISEAEQEILDGKAAWTMEGEEGVYVLEYKYGEEIIQQEVTISDSSYSKPENKGNGAFKSVKVNLKKTKPLGDFSIFGWQPGWLAWYILLSIIFSTTLRKLFKIY